MKKIILCSLVWMFVGQWLAAQQLLSLQDCRDLAVRNNKELQISAEKIKVAGYDKKAAWTKYFPQLSANGAYMWNQKDLNLLDMGQLSSALATSLGELAELPMVQQAVGTLEDVQHLDIQHIWIGNIALVQPIFMGEKIVTYNQIAAYAKELAQSLNEQQLQDLLYKTDETYWQVVSLVNKKKLADAYVELLRKTNEDITAMIEEGVATVADGLSVKVKLNEAETVQTKVDNGLTLSRMQLAQLCGLPLDEPVRLADEELDRLSVSTEVVAANVNEAFMNRSELRSLDWALKIYKKKERIVLADMLPSIAFSANYWVTNPNVFNGYKNDFAGMFNLGFIVRVPITGWWEGSYKRNAARAETRIKQLEWEDACEKIELQVNQSVYKVNEANKKLLASNRNMENAEENLRRANLGFEEGVIPALNLMEAQTAWISACSALIDAQIEMKLTRVYLNKALGNLPVKE